MHGLQGVDSQLKQTHASREEEEEEEGEGAVAAAAGGFSHGKKVKFRSMVSEQKIPQKNKSIRKNTITRSVSGRLRKRIPFISGGK